MGAIHIPRRGVLARRQLPPSAGLHEWYASFDGPDLSAGVYVGDPEKDPTGEGWDQTNFQRFNNKLLADVSGAIHTIFLDVNAPQCLGGIAGGWISTSRGGAGGVTYSYFRRGQGMGNGIRCQWYPAGASYGAANRFTLLVAGVNVGQITLSGTQEIEFLCVGTNVKLWANGSLRFDVNVAALADYTGSGMGFYAHTGATGATWDEFWQLEVAA